VGADAEQTAISTDGTRIAFGRSGTGDPLVVVHGTGGDRSRWSAVLPQLEARFTVYAVDRRGRGASGDGASYAIEREFEDVVAVLATVDEPVILLGHSYGAICSLEAAARADNVRRLILYEPPLPIGLEIYPPGLIDELQMLLDANEREGLLTTFLTEVVHVPADQLRVMRGLPSWPARLAAAPTIVREVRADENYVFTRQRWRDLETPTLLLMGGDSPPFLTEATKSLHASLPRATLRTMPGQQHAAMDTAPDMFVGEVVAFCAAG
jgi:pimeloyl-ACP methyl ester carboxylesterase